MGNSDSSAVQGSQGERKDQVTQPADEHFIDKFSRIFLFILYVLFNIMFLVFILTKNTKTCVIVCVSFSMRFRYKNNDIK